MIYICLFESIFMWLSVSRCSADSFFSKIETDADAQKLVDIVEVILCVYFVLNVKSYIVYKHYILVGR